MPSILVAPPSFLLLPLPPTFLRRSAKDLIDKAFLIYFQYVSVVKTKDALYVSTRADLYVFLPISSARDTARKPSSRYKVTETHQHWTRIPSNWTFYYANMTNQVKRLRTCYVKFFRIQHACLQVTFEFFKAYSPAFFVGFGASSPASSGKHLRTTGFFNKSVP